MLDITMSERSICRPPNTAPWLLEIHSLSSFSPNSFMPNETHNNMAPWKSFAAASSRLSSFKDYVNQRDYKSFLDGVKDFKPGELGHSEGSTKQSWRQWAGEKIRNRNQDSPGNEQVSLFPGWATRRYHQPNGSKDEDSQFSLDVFISGYASSARPPELATRSQRAFMRLATAFAALPKLPNMTTLTDDTPSLHLSPSTEELIRNVHLPPPPTDITEESELQALEHQFRHTSADSETSSLSSGSSGSEPPTPTAEYPPSSFSSPNLANGQQQKEISDLRRLHANLNARLQPFWSSSIANRPIRLSLYTSRPQCSASGTHDDGWDASREPVATQDVVTSREGGFQAKFNISWKQMCQHPGALHIAFGNPQEEHDLYILAEIISSPVAAALAPVLHTPSTSATSTTVVPITQSPVRLISDIDDTIKLSNILGGARAVFRNVFVKHLEELVIQGMGDWYTDMWVRGTRFHYVSNGPFQLLPVVSEFIKVSNLPPGSVKMKSYAGRSLFNGLLSAPATRKRDGIVDILDNFNSSQFFLVGDTGEQDLELYALLATERHKQILAVFLRDASGPDTEPLDDPTGQRIKHAAEMKRSGGSFASPEHLFDVSNGASSPASPALPSLPPPLLQKSNSHTPTQHDILLTPKASEQQPGFPFPRPPPRFPVRSSSMHINPPEQGHLSARSPSESFVPRLRTPVRSPSDPMPNALPSTFFDSDLVFPNSTAPGGSNDSCIRLPGILSPAQIQALSPVEKKRYELQLRVYKARMVIPSHVPLRIFKDPEECIEAGQILDDLDRRSNAGNGTK